MTKIVITNVNNCGNGTFERYYKNDHPTIKPILKEVKKRKKINLKNLCAYPFEGDYDDLMIAALDGTINGLVCYAEMDKIEAILKPLTDEYDKAVNENNRLVKVYNRSRTEQNRKAYWVANNKMNFARKKLLNDGDKLVATVVDWKKN